jgi:hypothetical protein
MPRYIRIWRHEWLTIEAKTLADMIHSLKVLLAELTKMHKTGKVTLEVSPEHDYVTLITSDPAVAKKCGLFNPDEDERTEE